MTTNHPYIHIEQRPDGQGGFNFGVKAGNGLDSVDHVVAALLLLVENVTGVSSDLYAKEIDIARRVARGGPLFPPSAEEQP